MQEHNDTPAATAAGQPSVQATADDLRHSALSWEPDARLVGNIRAEDIARLCTEALAAFRERDLLAETARRLTGEKDTLAAGARRLSTELMDERERRTVAQEALQRTIAEREKDHEHIRFLVSRGDLAIIERDAAQKVRDELAAALRQIVAAWFRDRDTDTDTRMPHAVRAIAAATNLIREA